MKNALEEGCDTADFFSLKDSIWLETIEGRTKHTSPLQDMSEVHEK